MNIMEIKLNTIKNSPKLRILLNMFQISKGIILLIIIMYLLKLSSLALILLIVFVVIFLPCIIILKFSKIEKSSTILIKENEIIITTKENYQIITNINEIKIIVLSHKDRGALFSFWKEMGFNYLKIYIRDGSIMKFIFILNDKESLISLKESVNNISNPSKFTIRSQFWIWN